MSRNRLDDYLAIVYVDAALRGEPESDELARGRKAAKSYANLRRIAILERGGKLDEAESVKLEAAFLSGYLVAVMQGRERDGP